MSVKRRTFLQGAAGAIGLAIAQGALSKIAYAQGAAGTLRVAIAKPAGNLDPQSHFASTLR